MNSFWKKSVLSVLMLVAVCATSLSVFAEDYYCEVMTLKGSAFVTSSDSIRKPLKEGDLLKVGDVVEVDPASQLDVAYDKEWNNITRIWENSKVTIKSILPTGLKLDDGDIFAKLHQLPKGTTFEIQTPTAVAAVRGTEFMTSVDNGVTSVVSFSPSPVEVFNLNSEGGLGSREILLESEKTVVAVDEPPSLPEKASEEDLRKAAEFSSGIETEVQEVKEEGRVGQIQDLKVMEDRAREMEQERKDRPLVDPEDRSAGNVPPGGGDGTDTTLNPDDGMTESGRELKYDSGGKLVVVVHDPTTGTVAMYDKFGQTLSAETPVFDAGGGASFGRETVTDAGDAGEGSFDRSGGANEEGGSATVRDGDTGNWTREELDGVNQKLGGDGNSFGGGSYGDTDSYVRSGDFGGGGRDFGGGTAGSDNIVRTIETTATRTAESAVTTAERQVDTVINQTENTGTGSGGDYPETSGTYISGSSCPHPPC